LKNVSDVFCREKSKNASTSETFSENRTFMEMMETFDKAKHATDVITTRRMKFRAA